MAELPKDIAPYGVLGFFVAGDLPGLDGEDITGSFQAGGLRKYGVQFMFADLLPGPFFMYLSHR